MVVARGRQRAWSVAALLVLVMAGTLNAGGYFQQVAPHVVARVDVSMTGKPIEPVWDAINIWDISILLSLIRDGIDPDDFRRDRPGVDTLVLMTFTGGRNDRWLRANDFVFRHSNGSLMYDFTNFTTVLDWCVAGSFKLQVVLGNTPHALARANETSLYGTYEALTGPPANYTEYRWYMQNLTAVLVNRYGVDVASSWEYRLYTEPDGAGSDGTFGWWSGGRDEYVTLWIETFSIIKAALPGARLVLGNLMRHWDPSFAGHVLPRIQAINSSLLPDVVSFSYYNDLVSPPRPGALVEKFNSFTSYLEALSLGKDFDLSVEEGFIINDEHGHYVHGDASELGAAWMAWMIQSCHAARSRVVRFTHWGTNMDEYLLPSGYVQLMARRMAGGLVVPVQLDHGNPVLAPQFKFIDGLASARGESVFNVLLYQFLPRRDVQRVATIDLVMDGIPDGTYNVSIFIVDSVNHNFFTRWLADTAHFPIKPGASRYNPDPSVLDIEGPWGFWWDWRHDTVNMALNSRQLTPASTHAARVDGGRANVRVVVGTNAVVFVELANLG